jgi:hypothetical protein
LLGKDHSFVPLVLWHGSYSWMRLYSNVGIPVDYAVLLWWRDCVIHTVVAV